MKRAAGTLMHITSLPSNFGIGTMGKEAYHFANFLKNSSQSYWQILPIGPTGFGDSPYQSFSMYAINPYLIDLDMLCEDSLLKKEDYYSLDWGINKFSIDYGKIYDTRFNVLKIAFENFKSKNQDKFNIFINENIWLSDYALYMAVKQHFGMISFTQWPDSDIRRRTEDSIKKYSFMLSKEIKFWMFLQFLAFNQWNKLKKYVNSLGLKIIGDIPIYVGLDSVETWVNPELFMLDENHMPTCVAGCPPDSFSDKGQLWGNPIYNWERLKKDNYKWWIKRFGAALNLFDIIRIDHFRGFDSYYSIPYPAENAKKGKWQDGPGLEFFNILKKELGDLPIIAEDLGFLTPCVKKMLLDTKYPGMKILQFAFDSSKSSDFLPHNYNKNCVAYTGTHDNSTIVGWAKSAKENEVAYAFEYGAFSKEEGTNWGMIRLLYSSVADLAVVPLQDYLGLDDESRMNIPSTLGGNWKWRVDKNSLTDDLANKIKKMVKCYGR
ncbi:MAG: 4-alpha-glucanotransferase [Eubacteriales bacterium SKADARSKE-1]|nr:4-alpha-glucanotransferase [Eubacteriales bacterium SKADARSKE-1]